MRATAKVSSARFFAAAFGMKRTGVARCGCHMSDGVTTVALLKKETPGERIGIDHFGLWVDDLESASRQAIDAGAVSMGAHPPGDKAFYEAKLVSANYYAERFLPDAGALRRKLEAGSEYMMKLPAEAFAVGTPTILLDVVSGHERENAALFVRLGVAELADTLAQAGELAAAVLASPQRQAAMRHAQRAFHDSADLGRIARAVACGAIGQQAVAGVFLARPAGAAHGVGGGGLGHPQSIAGWCSLASGMACTAASVALASPIAQSNTMLFLM